MGHHPCCCGTTCGGCCTNAADEYVVDFGAGGLTDKLCDACDQVIGEFTLAFNGPSTDCNAVDAACCWYYRDAAWCDADITCDVVTIELMITLYIDSDCKWNLHVYFRGGESEPCVTSGHTSYKSADAVDTCRGTFSLDRVVDWTEDDDLCDGNLPATITVEAL